MDQKVWIGVAALALLAAGFFGYRTYKLSNDQSAENSATLDLQRKLEESTAREAEAARKAMQEERARQLAEEKSKQVAEAEARSLAQAQSERQAQELARQRAEEQAAKAASELERIRGERAQLAAEAQRLSELRARDAADADAKIAAAKRALEESERKKNAEIERQAAVIASYNRAPPTVERAPAQTAEESTRRTGTRIIFPSDYKRANRFYSFPAAEAATGQ